MLFILKHNRIMATQKITSEQLRQFVLAEAQKVKNKLFEEEVYKILEDPIEQDMNQNDGLEDSDKALVFKNTKKTETKGGKAPKVAPADVKMNAEAKTKGSDEKAATAVSVKAGAEKGGKGVTAGQAKAVVKEKAPVVKDEAPIIKGIQTDQGNSNKEGDVKDAPKIALKESYTRQELVETIKREAIKLAKKSMLEEQLKRVNDELSKL